MKGRRLPLVIASFGFSIFNISVAVSKDLQTLLICRFFSGFFGACPLTCVAAVFSDMFDNRTRGMAITIFSMTVFTGPLMAPFIGGFIVMSDLGYRWTEYIVSFMGFFCFACNLLFLSESYPPQILVSKAAELRRRTKNWGIHAKQEEIEIDLRELIEKNFSRPLKMLVTERIVLLLSVYMAFIYGLLYLFLTAYPLVFQGVHGMNLGVGGLPFFGMITGQLLAGTLIFARQPGYQKKLAANNNVPIPEWRLPEVIVGGACFSAGLFWFGWTGYNPDVHWIGKSQRPIRVNLTNSLQYLLSLVSLQGSASSRSSFKHSTTSSTPISCSPRPPSPPTRSSVVCVELRFLSSLARCLKAWAFNGRRLCLVFWLHCLCLCLYGSTSAARRSGRRVRMHRLTLVSRLHRR